MKKDIRILYVEDVPADAVLVNHELRKAGLSFRMKRVDSKDAFVRELEKNPPDLILSDHGLPCFDGFAALKIARHEVPDVPFIFVTNSQGEETAIEMFESGATDCVLKTNLTKLPIAVDRALRETNERATLRESEECYRMLIDGLWDYAIFMLDPKGCITGWNSGVARLHGYEAGELRGRHFSMFYTAEDVQRGRPDAALKTAVADGHFDEEGIRVTKEGKTFWAHVTVTALRDSTGKLRGFSQVTRDISDRKKNEIALRESEERFRLLVERVTDYAIYMLDPEGHIVTWNEGAERIEGFKEEEIIGKPWATVFLLEDVQKGVPDRLLREAEKEGHAINEGWRARKDGSRFWSEGILTALRDEAGELRGFAKVAHDITRQKEAEEEIRRLNTKLESRITERTEQLEAANHELEAFSYSVSHDLRAPLRHIAGYVEILKMDAGETLNESANQHLTKIEDSVRSMGQLIDALLEFSRMSRTELNYQRISLGALVEEARRELQSEIKGRNVEWQIGKLPEVYGDPIMLRQVIINLLANALKYTRTREVAKMEIGAKSNSETVFFVRDNGVGFDPAYADKLFGVFQRLHKAEDFEGTGIGLANVRRIIHRHGGRTWAESAVNRGATFYFSIPKTKEKT
jgi:PAS domain S-box-containing protein